MKFKNFRLRAEPIIQDACCSKCKGSLTQIPNGFLSSVWYCEKCNSIYELRLIKVPAEEISQRFLEQYGKQQSKSILMVSASGSIDKRTPEAQLEEAVAEQANKEVIDLTPEPEAAAIEAAEQEEAEKTEGGGPGF